MTQRNRRHPRRGAQSLELMLTFIVTFVFGMTLYAIAQVALGNLYQVVATLVAFPYA